MKKLLLLTFIIFFATITFGCSSTTEVKNTVIESSQKNAIEIFSSKDGECTVEYDSSLWEKDKEKDLLVFNDKTAYIEMTGYKEKLSEKKYIDALLEEYKKHAIDGTITSTKQKLGDKEYPFIHLEEDKEKYILCRDTIVVMNGETQYELRLISTKTKYEDVKEQAYKVFGTVKLAHPSNVIYDEEMAQGLETLNQLAGIDKESVIKNVSPDGNELIGSWGSKNAEGKIELRFILTSDNKYSWYKSFPKKDNLLSGEWSYPKPRLLNLKLEKAIVDGKDNTSGLNPDNEYEILSFKDNTMKMRNLYNLSEKTYYKIIDN